MKEGLQDLAVLGLAEEVADVIWQCVGTWQTFNHDTVGKQLIRAADSIGANIAESYGRYHYKAWFSKSGFGFTNKGNSGLGKERIFSTPTIRFFLNPL